MLREIFTKSIAIPLIDLAQKTTIKKQLDTYNSFLYKDKSYVKGFQLKKLKALLIHAYQNVPFYTRKFDSVGFKVESFSKLSDLEKIPPLTRIEIQNNFNDLCANNIDIKNCSKGSSSGSTGEPVNYLHDSLARSAGTAANYFGWSLSGWQIGKKGLHIWGNPRVVNVEWKRFSSKLKTHFLRHYKYPAYKLTDEHQFKELVIKIKKGNYSFIDGYTNAIYLLAQYAKENNIEIPRLKYVLTTAENLQDYQRKLISETLGPVYDGYGCGEINGIAFQCKYCAEYHIIDPHVVVEYSKNRTGNDGSNPLYITDLDNYAMPLIRYMNGDMGIPSTKKCQVPLSSLKSISGRSSDIIEIPGGGNLVVPSFFGSMLLKQVKGIKQYQIEKTSKRKIIINLVIDKNYNTDDEIIIKESLMEYLQNKLEWEIIYKVRIPVSKTGKFKLFIDRTKEN